VRIGVSETIAVAAVPEAVTRTEAEIHVVEIIPAKYRRQRLALVFAEAVSDDLPSVPLPIDCINGCRTGDLV